MEVRLQRLRAHPANANVMSQERLAKLKENIRREADYPPLVVRPHPTETGAYEVLDGHQRWTAAEELGLQTVRCYIWPCTDEEALVLLATLNRLEGADDPLKRAQLLEELAGHFPLDELARLLPEDSGLIQSSMSLLDLNPDDLLRQLEGVTDDRGEHDGLRAITFVLPEDQARRVEEAVDRVAATLTGQNRRGRALALIVEGSEGNASD